MPFYEYECTNCKFYVEALQKVSEPPLKQCPSCKKQTLKKLVSAPVFRLKGGGWYETDFKSDQEGKRNLAASEEAEAKPAEEAKDAKPAETASAPDKSPAKKPAAAATSKSAAKKKAPARAASRPAKPSSKPKTKAAKRTAKRRR